MEITHSAATDVGRKRKANEDSFLAEPALGAYLVADGMGGHSCGDVASQTAVEIIRGKLELAKKRGALERKKNDKGPGPAGVFKEAIQLANRAVWELSGTMPGCKSMGTTVAGVLCLGESFAIAHVGDSRVYRIRGGAIEQLTRDHSLVEEQIAAGIISREEARTSSRRNVITRAMGIAEMVEVDVSETEARQGDILVICSDGLNSMAEDKDILNATLMAASSGFDKTAGKLIELANSKGGDDNITVVAIKAGR